jgi:Flp pilus assembly protein CpaB
MRGLRGVLVLALAVLLGLAATKAVSVYLGEAKPKAEKQPVVVVEQKAPAKPLAFTDSIPSGMRAVSVAVDDVTGVAGNILKGDRVDVVATTPLPDSKDAVVARVILENIEVLAVETENGTKSSGRSKSQRDWTVTLLVTPEQGATVVAAASEAKKISLLARRSDDHESDNTGDVAFTHGQGVAPLLKPGGNISEWVRPGMRAITAEVRDTDGICGLLRRRDRVDVIATCPVGEFDTGGNVAAGTEGTVTEFGMRSAILFQDVEVLASEKSLVAATDENEPVGKVSLLVTPQQAEKLAVAMDATKKSIIRLVLRNPDDRKLARTTGQSLAEILMKRRERSPVILYKGTQAKTIVF